MTPRQDEEGTGCLPGWLGEEVREGEGLDGVVREEEAVEGREGGEAGGGVCFGTGVD